MKIKSLQIDSYRHLQNLHFDFSYPEGHADAGKPLNKICLIGQSATGKTSVLELIKESVRKATSIRLNLINSISFRYRLDFDGKVEYLYGNDYFTISNNEIVKNGQEFKNNQIKKTILVKKQNTEELISNGLKFLHLSADIISKEAINIFNQNPISISNEVLTDPAVHIQDKYDKNNYIIEFGQEVNTEVWFSLLSKILDYRKRFTQMAAELINKGAIADPRKLSKQFAKWSETNENPLVSFAHYFNPILKKLNLEVDLINTEYAIPIKSGYNDEIIPIAGLSTGTKAMLLSMFPMYELDTTDSMILVDEPERSLFPDIQIELMSHYQTLAPEAQFIVATHSPFIAAAFEPEERFILYFDEDGKVAVRRGEAPIGDDPNDILRNDFNVDYYNVFGKKAYKQYLDLKRKVKDETETTKKKKLLLELTELGDKYNFE